MSSMVQLNEQEQLCKDINKKLAASGYNQRLKSVKVRKYDGTNEKGMNATEISYEFEKATFVDHSITWANIFVSRLLSEFLDSSGV